MCPAFQVVPVSVAVRWELVNGVDWNGRRRLHAKRVDGRRLSAHGLSDHLFEVFFLVVYGVHESPRCLLWWCDLRPRACALTPRRRLLGTGPRSHLSTLKSMPRSVATARTLMPPSKPRLDPQPTARMTTRTAVRNQARRASAAMRPLRTFTRIVSAQALSPRPLMGESNS